MKKEIRENLLKKRETLTANALIEKSKTIVNNLKTLDMTFENKNIMIYLNFKKEVITKYFIEYFRDNNCTIVIPKTNLKEHRLELYEYSKGDALEKSSYGILEPIGDKKEFNPEAIDFIITPGVGFRNDKYRIGYGGGFYDALIVKAKNAITIGVFFELQHDEAIPVEPHDQQLDYVVTEERIIK